MLIGNLNLLIVCWAAFAFHNSQDMTVEVLSGVSNSIQLQLYALILAVGAVATLALRKLKALTYRGTFYPSTPLSKSVVCRVVLLALRASQTVHRIASSSAHGSDGISAVEGTAREWLCSMRTLVKGRKCFAELLLCLPLLLAALLSSLLTMVGGWGLVVS